MEAIQGLMARFSIDLAWSFIVLHRISHTIEVFFGREITICTLLIEFLDICVGRLGKTCVGDWCERKHNQ